ncbi:hypothetical protein [Arachidicoccus sp.]|uniref:hypothetical protein n=1 Tax=Arachidicoccus sp. TaxID=1872624 RepID=UPI003D1ACA5B
MNKDGDFVLPVLLFDSTKIYYRFAEKKDLSDYINFNLDKPDILLASVKANTNKNTPLNAPVFSSKDTAGNMHTKLLLK